MKSAYVLSLVCCLFAMGLPMPAPPLQYQDSYGQYSFGYSSPTLARSEIRTLDGVTRGAYSYIDNAGFIQTAHYIADSQGFRIVAPHIAQTHVYLPSVDVPGEKRSGAAPETKIGKKNSSKSDKEILESLSTEKVEEETATKNVVTTEEPGYVLDYDNYVHFQKLYVQAMALPGYQFHGDLVDTDPIDDAYLKQILSKVKTQKGGASQGDD